MKKFTITYKALHKDVTFEVHQENKFLIFRKQLSVVSIDKVISTAIDILEKYKEGGVIIFFNGTPSDFFKLKNSILSKNAISIYHNEIYEDIENRLEKIELIHLEIQNSPYPLAEGEEREEREYIGYLANSDILRIGYCLLEHLWHQRNRLNEELLYDNNFSIEFINMLKHYEAWLDDIYQRLYKLLD